MKRHFIVFLVLYLLMISAQGCLNDGMMGLDCYEGIGPYNSDVLISIRDKQTGQPISHARVELTRIYHEAYLYIEGCRTRAKIVDKISVETDISGQYSYAYSGSEIWGESGVELIVDVTSNQYEPISVSRYIKLGSVQNQINIRMLKISNQP